MSTKLEYLSLGGQLKLVHHIGVAITANYLAIAANKYKSNVLITRLIILMTKNLYSN